MKLYATLFAAGIAAGALCTYYLFPKIERKIETKIETVQQLQIRTVTRTVERPDGTKIIEQETLDTSKIKASEKKTDIKVQSSKYLLGVTAETSLKHLEPIYGLQAQLRVLGPVWAGLTANADGDVGVSLSFEF